MSLKGTSFWPHRHLLRQALQFPSARWCGPSNFMAESKTTLVVFVRYRGLFLQLTLRLRTGCIHVAPMRPQSSQVMPASLEVTQPSPLHKLLAHITCMQHEKAALLSEDLLFDSSLNALPSWLRSMPHNYGSRRLILDLSSRW